MLGIVRERSGMLLEVVLALYLGGLTLSAQPSPSVRPTAEAAPINSRTQLQQDSASAPGEISPNSVTNTPLKEVRPGVFQLGEVRIDQGLQTVSFPARLNLSRGPMEYLLVAAWGKTHESILETETMPYRIHAAMLLLSANHGEGTNLVLRHHSGKVSGDEAAPGHSQFISHPSKRRLPGEKITL